MDTDHLMASRDAANTRTWFETTNCLACERELRTEEEYFDLGLFFCEECESRSRTITAWDDLGETG